MLFRSSITGTGTLTSTSAFDLQSGTVAAVLGGTAGATKSTAGTVTLSAANSYTGATTVSAGTLNVSGSLNTAGTAAVGGGTLDLQANSQQFAGVQVTGGTLQNGTVTLNTGNYDLQAGTVSVVLAGSAGIAKSGTGSVTLDRKSTRLNSSHT